MTRPVGPVKIESTEMKGKDVLIATLSGAVKCKVAVIRHGRKYYFKAPKKHGGTKQVPADSLTDCMNFSVAELAYEIKGKRGRKAAC